MAATTFGTSGATYGLSEETGGMIQSLDSTNTTDKEETRNHIGEVARVTYYNPTTDVTAEWVPTGATGISAAAVAAALTMTNTPLGTGKILVEELGSPRTNTTEKRLTFKAKRYPLIT